MTDDRDGPIERVIAFSVANRAVVLLVTLALALWGVHALRRTPIDAIPDLSENQVIVFTDWPGRSPQEIEDQVTYPLSVNLQGLAGVKAVRSTSEFNYSMVNVIFDEGVGFYFARDRVLERLSTASTFLPPGVVPYLAPDATALGQIFWYTVEGPLDPGELRSIQDWYVRYQLNAVPGVAQVASVGGFVQAYQVDVDPHKLRAYGVTLGQVFEAVARSNSAVGGDVLVKGGAEYLIRGDGWLRGTDDIASIVITERDGVPVFVRHVASVQLGPEPRRAALEKQGEAVGGVVLMRFGENPLEVTRRVKEKIAALQPGLPPGVRIVPFYDRTPLIEGAIATLRRTLLEEMAVASLMVFLVLFHLRSSIVICATLPLSVLLSFIAMHHLGVPSNIMSLSGIAISIGVLLDAGIVMTESAYTRLHEAAGGGPVTGDTRPVVLRACKLVGRPLFFSVLIMLVSFLPVFALEGIEGRMFRPLALTKTFALVGVAILAVTVVPALLPTFVRGRLRSEQESWVVRSVAEVYRPVLAWLLRRPRVVALCFAALLGLGLNLAPKLGREFMPPLDEGSIMDMPVTIPSASVSRAADDLAARDALLRRLPEVDLVVGKAGRAETPTDPSPVDMVETVITLRPRDHWPRRGVEYEAVLAAARAAVGEEHGNDVAMDAAVAFDRFARELSLRRLEEHAPALGLVLLRGLVDDLLAGRAAPDLDRGVVARRLADPWGPRLAAGPLEWEVAEAAREAARVVTASLGGDDARALLVRPPGPLEALAAPLRQLVAAPRPTLEASLFASLTARRDAALTEQVRRLEWELEDRAPAALREALEAAAAARGLVAAPAAPSSLSLRRKSKQELVQELDSIAQVPGWANIWTQPIINRVDMLATGVRTMIGVKVFGGDLDTIQRVADRVAEVLRGVPGAVDVFPDQIVGERYLEVVIDRERAARYGVAVQEVQDTIEVALGGRRVTTAIGGPPAPAGGAVRPGHEAAGRTDGRRRLPVRVRYARDLREDEAQVRRILVSGSAGVQVPLGEVADVRVVQGPSMIKSEDGLLRAYVQLNVRDRDVIGFVDEARRVVEDEVVAKGLPQGVYLEWSGQFEHQVRARERLTLIVPLVVFLIFVILYLTYQDLGDALLMMLAVPGALVGGLIFQALFDVSFSVAVWVGYIACFGLATETGIIMLVYLREAIERRGGLANIATVDELEAAVLEGAVQRLRPKLLTEGTTILGLVPMLMAEGVGAEVMRPMAAPVLGGVLLADEVIDVFIPVIFFWYRRRRWERLQAERAAAQADALEVTA
ncbi:MAG: efflux RND transporter permease subunit [Planctomycetes bacterium]|nr:efflux RND transporter permease subunit [Planctomycetota bacterium]